MEARKNKPVRAELELDCASLEGNERKPLWVYDGDKLEQATGRLLYAEHIVAQSRRRAVMLLAA